MNKQKPKRVLLDDDGELYEEPSRTHPQVRAAQYGCAGAVIAALIALLGMIIVKVPDRSGVLQPIFYILVENVLKNQGPPSATAPTVVVVGDTPSVGTLVVTRFSDEFRTQVIEEARRTAQASSPVPPTVPAATNTPMVIADAATPTSAPLALPGNEVTVAPTPAPVLVRTVTVSGKSNLGQKVTILKTGLYKFKWVGGAYCVFGSGKQCLTAIRIFLNSPVQWQGSSVSDDLSVQIKAFESGYLPSLKEAEEQLKAWQAEETETIQLSKDDYVTLASVDHRGSYADNVGEVKLEIWCVGTQ